MSQGLEEKKISRKREISSDLIAAKMSKTIVET